MSDLGQIIDHQAELQGKLDSLSAQIRTLGLALVCLALAVLILEVKLWRG